jgi:hypothetical protein
VTKLTAVSVAIAAARSLPSSASLAAARNLPPATAQTFTTSCARSTLI